MLREIGSVRQDSPRGLRRWFQDDYFDLYVWQDAAGEPLAFQLCYDRHHDEGTIHWSQEAGYSHARVDHGRSAPGHAMTPVLRPAGPPPYFRVYRRFLAAAKDWEPRLAAFISERLQEYRFELFGRRRPMRRSRRSR